MAGEGEHDRRSEPPGASTSPYVSLPDRQQQGAAAAGKPPKAKTTEAAAASSPLSVSGGGGSGSSEKALMKRTLVAQSKKIQQLTAKIDGMEAERGEMAQQVDAMRMAVFEASTRAEQTAEQYKRDAVDAAVREIAEDREAFAVGRQEALKRIGELEDALEIALKAAGGVHRQLLELDLSCEDLGKTSVHLSVQAQEAPAEDKPALAVAGETIEAVVGVMRAMERSGVFDILDPVEDEDEDEGGGGETQELGGGGEGPRVPPFAVTGPSTAATSSNVSSNVSSNASSKNAEAVVGAGAAVGGGAANTPPGNEATASSRAGAVAAPPLPPESAAAAAAVSRRDGESGGKDGGRAENPGISPAREAAEAGQGRELPTAAAAAGASAAAGVGIQKRVGEPRPPQPPPQQQQQGRQAARGEGPDEAAVAEPAEDRERKITAAAAAATPSDGAGSSLAPQERQNFVSDHPPTCNGDDDVGLGDVVSEAVPRGPREDKI